MMSKVYWWRNMKFGNNAIIDWVKKSYVHMNLQYPLQNIGRFISASLCQHGIFLQSHDLT